MRWPPSTSVCTMRAANGVGTGAILKDSTATPNNNAWNFIAASVDEATAFVAFLRRHSPRPTPRPHLAIHRSRERSARGAMPAVRCQAERV